MKRIAIIIAPHGFHDIEFGIPYNYFRKMGAEVKVFSTKEGMAAGEFGASVNVDGDLGELNADDYGAIVFVGGSGTTIVRADSRAVDIIKKAEKYGKVIGAICWSPTILAKAGILKGKKATVWLGTDREYGKTTKEVMEDFGAKYAGAGVVVDGNIVTADGPPNAEKYAKAIWALLGD
jgi:protease I